MCFDHADTTTGVNAQKVVEKVAATMVIAETTEDTTLPMSGFSAEFDRREGP
jgi:hypothetical protein